MPGISISRLTDELMALYSPPLRAASTRRQVAQVLREVAAVGVRRTTDLGPVAVARWIAAHPDRSAVTTQSHLRCLRSILGYCKASGYIRATPFAWRGVKDWVRADAGPAPRRRPGHRDLGEITRVLEAADVEAASGGWPEGRLRALVYVYAYLGLRAAEALHLWVEDVDLACQVVRVQAHPEDGWRPKTLRSAAVLPMARPLADVLGRWTACCGCRWLFPGLRRRGPWLTGGPGARPLDAVRALGQRAGVDGLTIHAFRKTLGTYAKTWGFSQLELKALLRHSAVETQRWYDDQAVESLRPAAARISFPRIA